MTSAVSGIDFDGTIFSDNFFQKPINEINISPFNAAQFAAPECSFNSNPDHNRHVGRRGRAQLLEFARAVATGVWFEAAVARLR